MRSTGRPAAAVRAASRRGRRPRTCRAAAGRATGRGNRRPSAARPRRRARREGSSCGGSGRAQLSSLPGRPEAWAAAAAIRAWPRGWRGAGPRSTAGDRWPRACSAIVGDRDTVPGGRGADAVVHARTPGLVPAGRGVRSSRRRGRSASATRAPAAVSAANISSRCPATSAASNPGRSRSLTPATTVARPGRRASAGPSCSARTCPATRPRTARLAYRRPGSTTLELLGEPVRPAAQAGRVVPVADALGLAVAQGDVAQVLTARHGWSAFP